MLEQISWSLYLTAITFLCLFYYGWVYLRFYRSYQSKGVIDSSAGLGMLQQPHTGKTDFHDHSRYQPKEATAATIATSATMLHELDAFMQQAAIDKPGKEIFLQKMESVAKKYDAPAEPSDIEMLVQLLQYKSRTICSIDLREDEIVGIWRVA